MTPVLPNVKGGDCCSWRRVWGVLPEVFDAHGGRGCVRLLALLHQQMHLIVGFWNGSGWEGP